MLIRILTIAACGAGGFFAASAFNTPPPSVAPVAAAKAPELVKELTLPSAAESTLISEWEQLNAAHGGDNGGIYSAVKDTKDAFRRRAFRSALIAEWSVRDPQAALAFMLEKDSGNAGQLAREWLRRDPQGAINGLMAGGDKARSRLRSLLKEIAKVAPGRLVEVITALKAPDGRWDTSATDAFATFAANEPDAARVAAESVTGELRGQALAGVAKAWAEKDGNAALAWAQAMPEGDARDQALKAVLAGWAKTDPMAALGKLDLAPPGNEENYYASDTGAQVLKEAAKKDWNATIEWLRENPGKLGRSSLDGLQNEFSRRLGTDTTGMMQLLVSGKVPGLDMVFGNAVLNDGYAHREAMWTWLEGQPANDVTRNLRGSLLNAMGYKEPDAALAFLDNLPNTPENAMLLERGVSSIINGGSRMNQIESLLEKASPKVRAQLIETSFMYGAMNNRYGGMGDPQKWVARLNEIPAERRANATTQLAGSWAGTDPQAALKWASGLPEKEGRDNALASVTASWAANDPHEAARWVDTLPAGGSRDRASGTLVSALARSEPETAWTWALSIQSDQARADAMRMAYMGLRKKDPAIAEQMIEGSNLPAEQLKTLRDSYKPGMENQFFPR
jgi:hypothetical protein